MSIEDRSCLDLDLTQNLCFGDDVACPALFFTVKHVRSSNIQSDES
jgi:hypothetical protein